MEQYLIYKENVANIVKGIGHQIGVLFYYFYMPL